MLPNWNNAKNTREKKPKTSLQLQRQKSRKKQAKTLTAVPLTCSPAAHQKPTNPAVTFAFISFSVT